MAVMLDCRASWHAGLTLYRGSKHPFSDRDRDAFQQIVPSVANALRNCKTFAAVDKKAALLDEILRLDRRETVLMASRTLELDRSLGASALIARWFGPAELGRAGIPQVILDHLDAAIRSHGLLSPPPEMEPRRQRSGVELQITIVPVPRGAESTAWAVVLREVHPLPESWREILTPRELEVAARVVLGWDNRLIAEDLRCTLGTVKKHLQHIFDKLGMDRRGNLQRRAAEER
jgi:DNA-binding CsgD family transcriptional regulator